MRRTGKTRRALRSGHVKVASAAVLLARCDHDQQEAPRAITREIAEILKDLEGSNAASSAIALLASRLACIFKDGFRACVADGTRRWVPKGTSEATLRAAITRNGGDEPDWEY